MEAIRFFRPAMTGRERRENVRARAIVFTAPFQVEIRQFELPPPKSGQVLIESVFTCISPGTELRRLRGREALGDARFPFVPGYCLSGTVIEAGPETPLAPGTRVITCGTVEAGGLGLSEGGHTSHAIAPLETVVPVPDDVDLLDGSAAILAGICYHGLLQSRPLPQDKVAAVGLGAIGQLAARLHLLSGAEVVGCDLSPGRVELADRAGVRSRVGGGDLASVFRSFFPQGADVVIDSTGVPQVILEGMKLARRKPWNPLEDSGSCRYLIQGSYEGTFCVSYPDAYAAQVTILLPKGSQATDWKAALDIMAEGRLQVRDLITEVSRPEEAALIYEELARPMTRLLTAAFRW
jgi:2-desacetyl-2-hydroxyethyl bacteriochlorophyllide A dehydrogenase